MTWCRPYSRETLRLPVFGPTSARLTLRPIREGDGPGLFAMDSDPDVMRYIPVPVPDTVEDYKGRLRGDLDGGERFRFILAIDEAGNGLVGWVHFRPTEDGQWVEIGYRLQRDAWGRGIATEAARLLMDWGYKQGVRHLSGHTMAGNAASRHVLEKLGLVFQRADEITIPETGLVIPTWDFTRELEG